LSYYLDDFVPRSYKKGLVIVQDLYKGLTWV